LVPGMRVLALFGLVFSLVASCSPGELHLTTAEREAEEEPEDESMGGSFGEGPDDGTGGMRDDEEDPDPELPEIDFLNAPCVVRGDCEFFICQPDEQCPSCSTSLDCYPLFPHCDLSLNRCQECLSDSDCGMRFGPLFGACSAGRCVQCRTDLDCPERKCEHGWCGHCQENWDCQDGLVCEQDHCVPPLLEEQ
jgi:Cys-rich repeat protein